MLKVLAEKTAGEELAFGIDEICREGAAPNAGCRPRGRGRCLHRRE